MKFIQKHHINKRLSRFAKRRKKEKITVCSLEKAENLCLFFSFECQERLEQIVKSADLLKKNKKNIALFCFIPKKSKELPNQDGIIFFHKKDFHFTGKLKKEKLHLLQEQHFDLLIDLDSEPSLFSLYLSAKIKAKFRLGRCPKSALYYNVILYSEKGNETVENYLQSVALYTGKII